MPIIAVVSGAAVATVTGCLLLVFLPRFLFTMQTTHTIKQTKTTPATTIPTINPLPGKKSTAGSTVLRQTTPTQRHECDHGLSPRVLVHEDRTQSRAIN